MPSNIEQNKEEYDVFIAGAGIIACTFARILVDKGRTVGMADAGAYESRQVGRNHKNIWKHQRNLVHYGHFVKGQMYPASVPSVGPPSTRNMINPAQKPEKNIPGAVVVYAVGGMAIHWTCAIPRHDPDLERIGFISSRDWEVLYKDAEELLNKHTDVFSGSVRHKVLKRFLKELGWTVEDTPLAAVRLKGKDKSHEFVEYTGADTVLGENLAEPGRCNEFTIHPEHRVTRLICDEGKVKYAEVLDINTREVKKIYAKKFVVAAGWLHTAQILWNSELHETLPALGRYLTDHTFTGCTVVLKQEIMKEMGAEAMKTPQTSAKPDSHPLSVPMKEPPPHLYIPVSKERPWHSMIFRESFHYDPLPDNVDDRRIVDLKWFGMVEPRKSNHVTFASDNHDMLGMPQPTFHFRLSDDDKKRQHEMMIDMQNVAFELGDYLPGYGPVVVPLGTATHTMGATRMGPDDDEAKTSVVDSHSKVWGVENLYVGGNCVIPTRNASNPTLTSVALAIRAALHLNSKI